MRISHRYNFVFLAYPRTASRTIRTLLDELSDVKGVHLSQTSPNFPFHHHISARELKPIFDIYGWNWSEYKRFCVVRNPYSRLVSLFLRRKEFETKWDPRLSLFNNIVNWFLQRLQNKFAFTLFVLTRNPDRGVASNLQSFIGDKNGDLLVEDVLRYERLLIELPEYLSQFSIQISPEHIPRLNVSKNNTLYTKWYSPLTRKKIETMYGYEIKRFGYKFGG